MPPATTATSRIPVTTAMTRVDVTREAIGMLMGGIGLLFGGKGLEGLVSNFGLLDTGVGQVFRSYSFRLITKIIHKAVSNGLQSFFKKLFHEGEASLAKEE